MGGREKLPLATILLFVGIAFVFAYLAELLIYSPHHTISLLEYILSVIVVLFFGTLVAFMVVWSMITLVLWFSMLREAAREEQPIVPVRIKRRAGLDTNYITRRRRNTDTF